MKGETFLSTAGESSAKFSILECLKNHPLQVLIFMYSSGESKPNIITTINIEGIYLIFLRKRKLNPNVCHDAR